MVFRVTLKRVKLWHHSFTQALIHVDGPGVGGSQLLFLYPDLNGGGKPEPREGSPGRPWLRESVAQAAWLLLEGWQG